MSRKVRSMRGEMIDLDLFQIKQQIANTPKTTTVQERENFVDRKLRRRVKKQQANAVELDIDPMVKETLTEATTNDVPVEVVEPTITEDSPTSTRKRRG